MPILTHKQYLRAIGAPSRAVLLYVRKLKAALLRELDPLELVKNVDTGTLQASEHFFEGEPQGRGLTYGPEHSPEGAAEREAVLAAVGTWGAVGVANDAQSLTGFPYVLLIERDFGELHRKAWAALGPAFRSMAPQLWDEAMAEAMR